MDKKNVHFEKSKILFIFKTLSFLFMCSEEKMVKKQEKHYFPFIM